MTPLALGSKNIMRNLFIFSALALALCGSASALYAQSGSGDEASGAPGNSAQFARQLSSSDPLTRQSAAEALAKLAAIDTLSDTANTTALKQLEAMKAALPADTGYPVRRELMTTLARLLFDAGRSNDAYQVDAQLLALAEAQHDTDTAALARLGEIARLLDQNNPAQTLVKLERLRSTLKSNTNPAVQMRLHTVFGHAYNLTGKFDQALAHYLEALKLSDQQPRRSAQIRLGKQMIISQLYINMKNPEKALATTREALAHDANKAAPKTLASLYLTQGAALGALGRDVEALTAFQQALDISRAGGLTMLEANVLGNIADHHLHEQRSIRWPWPRWTDPDAPHLVPSLQGYRLG